MGSQVTIEDVANQLALTHRTPVIDGILTDCLAATVELVDLRLGPWVIPTDPWPANVEEAVLLQAARLYKRRNSPEGVTGFGDLGVVRITALDPDIDQLLGPDLAYWFA